MSKNMLYFIDFDTYYVQRLPIASRNNWQKKLEEKIDRFYVVFANRNKYV